MKKPRHEIFSVYNHLAEERARWTRRTQKACLVARHKYKKYNRYYYTQWVKMKKDKNYLEAPH